MQPSDDHAALEARQQKRGQRMLWVSMIVGVVVGGVAFVYKIVEFMFTLSAPEAQGFAEVPVAVYFCVAAGWLFLLVWCFATGKFDNLEQVKFDMLAREAELEAEDERYIG